jgi:phospholipid/cholesterol/gamma-HCH transport system permease protein
VPSHPPRAASAVLGTIGEAAFDLSSYLGGLFLLFVDALWWMSVGPWRGKGKIRYQDTLVHMERLSIRSFGIVSLVIFFVGIILAFQMAYVLKTLGVTEYVANIVGVAMTREMAPLLVAMVMTGFMGAAIAAEIGTMVVSEEVLALEIGAFNPVRFLVVPRVLSTMVVMPFVNLVATYIGVLGGFTLSYFLLGIEGEKYLHRTFDSLHWKDIFAGLLKSEAFGVLIALIACQEGLRVTGGAEGVGRATTNSVVRSVVAIIICDLIFTAFFYFFL